MICFLRGSQVFQTQIRFRTKKSSSFIFSGTQKKKKKKKDSIRPQILSISFHEITIFIVKKKYIVACYRSIMNVSKIIFQKDAYFHANSLLPARKENIE